jgi:hypothetical protein
MPLSVLSRFLGLVLLLTLAAPSLVVAQEATPGTMAGTPGTVVVDGIANPRGFVWAADGTMYLSVSGTGGDTPGPEGSPFSGGDTAAVAIVQDGEATMLAEGLPSAVWRDIDWVWGVMDLAILGDQLYALDGGGGAIHGNPDAPSGIYVAQADGTAELLVDLGAWVDANPVAHEPWEGVPNNGSFFAMAPVGDALWVVESVNGQVLEVTPAGAVRRIADLSADHPVPTGIAPAPDGGAYVGTLTAAPYPPGEAKVVHVAPDGTVEDVWRGLTAVTGVTVGPDGALYAAEIATEVTDAEPFLAPGTGRIVRQTGPDGLEEVAAGLNLPVALRFGPDGGLYVALPAFGDDAGTGSVLRLDVTAGGETTDSDTAAPLATPSE